jgi:hypothetical protein
VIPKPELPELPAGWPGWLVGIGGIIHFVLNFFLKKQKNADVREAHLVPVLIARIEKMEVDANIRIAKVEAEAGSARRLHLKCMEENAALRVDIVQLHADVKALQERG